MYITSENKTQIVSTKVTKVDITFSNGIKQSLWFFTVLELIDQILLSMNCLSEVSQYTNR